MPPKVIHILSGVAIGGMERTVIQLASRGNREGMDHTLLLFDSPFRSEAVDLHPRQLDMEFVERRPGVDFRFVQRLARKFARSQPQMVHAHNDTAIFYSALALFAGRVTATRLIGTFHTRPAESRASARWLTRWASARASETVAVSDELSEWLVRRGWVRRCSTIWNGTDLNEFSPAGDIEPWRKRLGIPEKAIVVGHVGRFAAIKRQADLFEVASRLQKVEPPICFLLAGSGPLFEMFHKRAAEMSNVFLLSNLQDVASFLRAIDIFVLCSEHEGAPQALLEAMACARPIIATSVGGIPHLLEGEGAAPAGRLIPPLRPDRLAEEIMRLARDTQLRIRLARLASERVQQFSFEREWARYAAVYLRLGMNPR